MTKTLEQAISELMTEIATQEGELRKKKESVNTLCAVDGRPAAYQIETADAAVPSPCCTAI